MENIFLTSEETEQNATLLMQGTLLNNGNYQIIEVLGRGGFGVTYLGQQQSELGLHVAIKEYYPKKIAHRSIKASNQINPLISEYMTKRDIENINNRYHDGKRRFIDEAKRLAEFNELPSIVSVLAYFEENNTAYIVMEYINGIDLYKFMQNNKRTMSVGEVKKCIIPILEDLDKVHKSGIIHRDISPDNIMISQSGTIKLIDFGASITRETEEEVKILRKNGFAPLEQYEKEGNNLGAWTDVYGLCATIYMLLSGKMVPNSRDRQFFDHYKTLRSQNIMVPTKLDKILKKGLAVDYKKRYQTTKELMQSLRRVHEDKKITAWILPAITTFIGMIILAVGCRSFFYNKSAEMETWKNIAITEELGNIDILTYIESASDYAIYGDLVYIRYLFDDGTIMLIRSPIGTDNLEQVEYVTDGSFDSFCIYERYLYIKLIEDQCIYRVDISTIDKTKDEEQQISEWKRTGQLEKVTAYGINNNYLFHIVDEYLYSVVNNPHDSNVYEIQKSSLDGKTCYLTELQLQLNKCLFYDGYIYMTTEMNNETVLSRMRVDGCYYEVLQTYNGEIADMKIADGKIYYLFNANTKEERSCLGMIGIGNMNTEILSYNEDDSIKYEYMTGIVDEKNIYYTCSKEGLDKDNNLYCYSLLEKMTKQISSECGRYIVTSDEIDSIIFASMDGKEIRQMNKDGSNPRVMREESEMNHEIDITSLSIIKNHVYYLDGGSVAYKKIEDYIAK
ncbi:protein kinase [Lachnospiraceae bacterium OttesenSCG-928-D06]|nr:protein kinase [Lachnospiraceae bacterium OttesenSCG-928-D06]